MHINEFFKLRDDQANRAAIFADNLTDQSDRTLLYGYDADFNTVHAYLKDRFIHVLTYRNSGELIIHDHIVSTGFDIGSLVSKFSEVSPTASDYEFCALIQRYGADIPFKEFYAEDSLRHEARVKQTGFAGEFRTSAEAL